ncbi:Crp/Fnr family transcriptional regulator [Roseobacteraceae bacterium S113]
MEIITNNPQLLAYTAGGLFAVGYVTVNQLSLRVWVLTGTLFYLWYYSVVSEAPLWEAIYMSSLTGMANLIGLAQLLLGKSRFAVPRAHRDIYQHFKALPPGDFRNILREAVRETLPSGSILTHEGADVHALYYVISGDLEIEKHGERFSLPSNVFVGEVAYMTERASSATSRATTDIEVLRWDIARVRARSLRNTRFKLALDAMVSRDMALKVAFAVAPHHEGWDHKNAMQSLKSAAP